MQDMEEKLGAILSNPQLMQQIMSMAQSFGQQTEQKEPDVPAPGIDPRLLGQISNFAGNSRNERYVYD